MTKHELDDTLPAPTTSAAASPPEEVEKLILDNIKLAYWFANRYDNVPGVDREDVERQAISGLVKAANMYNPAKGAFAAYASVAIQKHLAHMNFHQHKYAHHEPASLNAPAGGDDDSGAEVIDTKAGVDDSAELKAARSEAKVLLARLMQELTPRERAILTRSLSGESYRDMQKDLGISFVQIGNVARAALLKLKTRLEDYGVSSLPDILPESLQDRGDSRLMSLLEHDLTLSLLLAKLPIADRARLVA